MMIQERLCDARSAYRLPLTLLLLIPIVLSAQTSSPKAKRPITVADDVQMATIVHDDHSASSSDSPAYFSPDGKQFVVVLTKENLEKDCSDFSMVLYQTADVLRGPKPNLLIKMSSSSFRAAISQIRWLNDNDTLVFLGENFGELSQIYSFQVSTRTLKKLTNQPTPISGYDITGDGHTLAFMADPQPTNTVDAEIRPAHEIAVEGQDLQQIVAGHYSLPEGEKIFWQAVGSLPHPVLVKQGYFADPDRIFISPDGRYVLFSASLGGDRINPAWIAYRNEFLQQILASTNSRNISSGIRQYMLFDSQSMSSAPLLNAPIFGGGTISWSSDKRSVFVTSYLPLDITDLEERKRRVQERYPVEVRLFDRQYHKVGKADVPAEQIQQRPPIEVTLEQDVNTPPKLYVTDVKNSQKVLLLDPNPQFNELEFGHVETIEWEVDGAKIIGGLYLPPHYQPGKRYPLVIQTHGFDPKEFSMDGRSEWSSGFAARALAARDILVLQAENLRNYQKDHDRIGNDRGLGATGQESFKNFSALLFEGAIEFLDKRGTIDRSRVGIVGFSRTVCFVAYTLTHSNFRFAAASLVDGTGCGYFDEMAFPSGAWDFNALNGGAAPFGEGLKLWMKNSPGFNLDKVDTPVRLVALGKSSLVGDLWQWYAGLSLLKKPVDLVMIPGAAHIYGKASERLLKQQGLVDWFAFWLKNEEDSSPDKTTQYARWRELRKEQAALSAVTK